MRELWRAETYQDVVIKNQKKGSNPLSGREKEEGGGKKKKGERRQGRSCCFACAGKGLSEFQLEGIFGIVQVVVEHLVKDFFMGIITIT